MDTVPSQNTFKSTLPPRKLNTQTNAPLPLHVAARLSTCTAVAASSTSHSPGCALLALATVMVVLNVLHLLPCHAVEVDGRRVCAELELLLRTPRMYTARPSSTIAQHHPFLPSIHLHSLELPSFPQIPFHSRRCLPPLLRFRLTCNRILSDALHGVLRYRITRNPSPIGPK